jgi:hypothetical protein
LSTPRCPSLSGPEEREKLPFKSLCCGGRADNLLFLVLLVTTFLGLSGLGLLSANTAGTTATEGRGEGKVNVLLRVETDNERRNVDDLLANTERKGISKSLKTAAGDR